MKYIFRSSQKQKIIRLLYPYLHLNESEFKPSLHLLKQANDAENYTAFISSFLLKIYLTSSHNYPYLSK